LRFFRIHHVDELIEESRVGEAPFEAVRIYYGWAAFIIVEGDPSVMTKANIAALLERGAPLEARATNLNLRTYAYSIGLPAARFVLVRNVDEVAGEFAKLTAPPPSPILVEYRARQAMYTQRIEWQSRLPPGEYQIHLIGLHISRTRADGKPWDSDGSPPDARVSLILNGTEVATVSCEENMFMPPCFSFEGTHLNLRSAGDSIQFVVVDEDAVSTKPIGMTAPVNILEVAGLDETIDLPLQGRLELFRISLSR
jgi:hypothetical protein